MAVTNSTPQLSSRAERVFQSAHKLAVNKSWQKEQRACEIFRLESIQRDPSATGEEKSIAADMLAHWQTPEPVVVRAAAR
jgi:hypothetical protein